MKPLFAGLAALPVALAPAMAVSAPPYGPQEYGPGMMWDGFWWPGMMFGPLMMIVFLVVLVVLAVLAVRWLGHGPTHHRGAEDRALALLRERYARGEIDQKEYEERRRILES